MWWALALALVGDVRAETTDEASNWTGEAIAEFGGATPRDAEGTDQRDSWRPDRTDLPDHARQHTGFTAYTLEWGEVRLGLGDVALGVLPRVEVGTSPLSAALGAPSVRAGVNLLRAGPMDVAVRGAHTRMGLGELQAQHTQAGLTASLQLRPRWSLHTGLTGSRTASTGWPTLSALPGAVGTLTGVDLHALDLALAQVKDDVDPTLRHDKLRVEVATDVRLSRASSIILQGTGAIWDDVTAGSAWVTGAHALPENQAGSGLLACGLSATHDGDLNAGSTATQARTHCDRPLAASAAGSISFQQSWRHLSARVGLGLSATPGAWTTQAFELSYHFGGRTRAAERVGVGAHQK